MTKTYDIAAYIWPSYTGDEPRTRIFWEEGYGEWQTVKKAKAKFPGHTWPRKPLWGYVNEADPYVMEMQINAAADHGVNVFIYDWYWYDGRPFLEQCLNNGFLCAKNNDRMKFYLMWANHTVTNLWDIRNSHNDNTIWDGAVDRRQFEIIAHRLIEKYFIHPCYYKIDGKPVFMLYDIDNLIRGLGGIDEVKKAYEWFEGECIRAGLPGLHLQHCSWGERMHSRTGSDWSNLISTRDLFGYLGYGSFSNYQFVHFVNIDRDYETIIPDVLDEWKKIDSLYDKPYFPHVSLGWDTNPRFLNLVQGIVKNNSPDKIEIMLRHAKDYLDAHPNQAPLVTINSWNEWTETSYLEPDDIYGYGYLQAVKKVFVD